MGYIYNQDNIKTKQDAINQLREIEAYRSLEGLPFDFGNGLIKNDLSYGTEEAYWEMDIQDLEDLIEYWDWNKQEHKIKNIRLNHYARKIITKNKLKKVYDTGSYFISFEESTNRYKRFYLSGVKGYAKWCSKRAVRNSIDFPLKGTGYRKVYNYWYTVF